MRAEVVATPVLERLAAGVPDGVVRGATERAAYLDLGGFVVALTAPGVPLMPNGIAVERTTVGDGPVRAGAGRIALAGGEVVALDGAATWEPALPRFVAGDAEALRGRGAAMAAALGDRATPDSLDGARGREGLEALRRAVRDRDADAAARASERLLGLGGGLTPEGDDVLTATAAVMAAAGDALGFTAPERERFVAALVPADAAVRTTALSATLLALGAAGRVVEPVHRLLDLRGGDAAWREALATLEATGASTGRAYAAAVAATLLGLAV